MISKELYDDYFKHLINGDKKHCHDIVQDLLDKKIDARELYLDLFQTSLYEVGKLWETNRISVAVEHLASSITEALLNLVYPSLFAVKHVDNSVIIACIQNELHQIGAKMIADIFELNGWDSYFLGSNTPGSELLQMIREKKPDILGLSMSIHFHLPQLLEMISMVQAAFPKLRIIVGGQGLRWGGQSKIRQLGNTTYIDSIPSLEQFIEEFGNAGSSF